jgi:hypothetical protein
MQYRTSPPSPLLVKERGVRNGRGEVFMYFTQPRTAIVLCKIIFTPQIQQRFMKHPFPQDLVLDQLLGCLRRLLKIGAKIQDKSIRVRSQLEKNNQFDAIALL